MTYKRKLKKLWRFIWYDDSWSSWFLNIIIAFLLVKFLIYPGFGLILSTPLPVVAVVSSSMTHNSLNFDDWWEENKEPYIEYDISKEDFRNSKFSNGFNKGDIMVLKGAKEVEKRDVVVYKSRFFKYPIIHRAVTIDPIQTKGDNNEYIDNESLNKEEIIGKAIIRIPLLGWVKIWFTDLIQLIRF
tara:strand:+ start:19860 stop:20417 length:558 start_codon:yes stop_codon:yes gene_type:complete